MRLLSESHTAYALTGSNWINVHSQGHDHTCRHEGDACVWVDDHGDGDWVEDARQALADAGWTTDDGAWTQIPGTEHLAVPVWRTGPVRAI